jgi:copper transport protein
VTRGVRRAIAALGAGLVALAIPLVASAHALLTSSSPAAGARLGTAPGVVVLEFSQFLNARLSHAEVIDPTGHQWPGQVDSAVEMRIPLATNASGVYTVDWTSVSDIDGHVISGSFSFDVGVGPSAGQDTAALNAIPGPQLSDVAIGAVKWVEALALLFLTGQVLLSRLAARAPPIEWVKPGYRAASIALSAGLVVVWAEATVASGGHSLSDYVAYFGSGLSGIALLVRLGFEVLALVAVLLGSRTLPFWIAGALIMLAASGHAAGVEPAWFGIGLDALHLVAAGLWAGGIAALAVLRPPGGWRSPEARGLLNRFTPVALCAFGTTVVAGGLEAVEQLGSVQALFGTDYGRVLLAKMALVAMMLPLSLLAWRLRRPHVRIEASIAVCVVAAAALLASFPVPPTTAERQAAAEAVATPTLGLPAKGDLTMAGNAGSVLVGLSLSPGTPGPNHVTVYLLPVDGSAAARGLPANLVVNNVYSALHTCGNTCRNSTADIQPGDKVGVEVLGSSGGLASFTIPEQLPAPPGAALVTKLESVMQRLTAYQVNEVLNSGITTVDSAYASDAPDRSKVIINGESTSIWIGTSLYTQSAPGQPWSRQTTPAITIPYFVWDEFQPLTNAHVLGAGVIDGVSTTMVSTFGNAQATPIWFTFWIDATGRVRQVAMDAPGHFMTDTYVSYDKPIAIDPPAG